MGFESIVGQEGIIKVLKRALDKDTLSHAIIFKGPEGSGKSTLAMLLARALNCISSTGKPCENCLSCLNILKGEHPDVVVVEAEGRNIKIDQIREVKRNFSYYTHGSGTRVCFIKNAHNLTDQAAASLLKILEEPPSGLVFILSTPYPFMLPDTVLSRCQHFTMKKVSGNLMEDLLSRKRPEVSTDNIAMALKMGEGIPGRALDVAGDPLWQERQRMVFSLGEKLLTGSLADKDLLLEAKEWSGRNDLNNLLELFSYFLRDGLLWSITANPQQLTDSGRKNFWENNNFATDLLKDLIVLLNNIRGQLQSNVNINLALDAFFFQLKGRLSKYV